MRGKKYIYIYTEFEVDTYWKLDKYGMDDILNWICSSNQDVFVVFFLFKKNACVVVLLKEKRDVLWAIFTRNFLCSITWMVCLPPNCVLTTIQILRKQIEKQKSTTKQTRPYTTKYNKNPKDQNLKNKQSNLAVNVK